MKIAVCIDDRNGMLFAGRRQSMDSCLRSRFLAMTEPDKVWMDAYTAGQFADAEERIRVDADYLAKAEPEDWCFVEKADLPGVAEKITTIVLYRWNRHYPSDKKFPMELFADRWTLISREDFSGSSHERITEEVYNL